MTDLWLLDRYADFITSVDETGGRLLRTLALQVLDPEERELVVFDGEWERVLRRGSLDQYRIAAMIEATSHFEQEMAWLSGLVYGEAKAAIRMRLQRAITTEAKRNIPS